MSVTPRKPARPPVARKVKAATGGAVAGGGVAPFVVWALDELFWNGDAAPEVPDPVVAFVLIAVPAVATFVAGWLRREAPVS